MSPDTSSSRCRAASTATPDSSSGSLLQAQDSSPSKHTRATSDNAVPTALSSSSNPSSKVMTMQITQDPSPASNHDPPCDRELEGPIPEAALLQALSENDDPLKSSRDDGIPDKMESEDGDGSLSGLEGLDLESLRQHPEDVPLLQRDFDAVPDRPKAVGCTFDELVDRLLNQPMSKADMNFIEIFLCLYRKLAAPGVLLSAILTRFEKIANGQSQHFLTRTGAQLRIMAILTKWITAYPGDFASPHTSQQLNAFLEQQSMEPAFNYATQVMKTMLHSYVAEDDDTKWEQTDADAGSEADEASKNAAVTSARAVATSTSASHSSSTEEKADSHKSEAVSISSGDASMFSRRPSGLHTVADYEIEAATMVPQKKRPITKITYHACMDISDDDFADEITRIDWVMFSSVRVRDLIRDVSLSPYKKTNCRSLVNVSRAINNFNHVASWVSNMILMRDKPKHRVQILEKFMRIAWKLRQLNNYNGLAAVMAGIQSIAVARLAQTQALINEELRRQFMRLEILMSPRRSHFAYRLAWQNSPLPRIPYVPLSRRDLASAEEGSKTFVDSGINWSKFSLLGDVILPLLTTRGASYDIGGNSIVRELILESTISMDDEELYERSLQLESTAGALDQSNKNKIKAWFK